MMEELKRKLMECYKEELEDVASYKDMSDEAYEKGMHEAAGILSDISNDEQTHAEALECILNMLDSNE